MSAIQGKIGAPLSHRRRNSCLSAVKLAEVPVMRPFPEGIWEKT
jgi:hypothetical protein